MPQGMIDLIESAPPATIVKRTRPARKAGTAPDSEDTELAPRQGKEAVKEDENP